MPTPTRQLYMQFLPHAVAVLLFLLLPCVYFSPLLEGKEVAQHDRDQWLGTAKELIDYKEAHGEQSLWTNRLFGGMPSVLVSLTYPKNVVTAIDRALNFLPRPAGYIFLTMLGFYLLLLVAGVNPWLAIPGAVAYGFSTYFFIIVGAGHNAKSHALCYMAPMVGGVILAYRGRLVAGGALFALFLALSLVSGHLQITYYTAFVVGFLALAYLVEAIRTAGMRRYIAASAVLLLAGVLAVGANFNRLYQTWEYSRESIRGPAVLASAAETSSGGLDHAYATAWSYGKAETFNLLIPNLMGGGSTSPLRGDSRVGQFLAQTSIPPAQQQMILSSLPTYWGPQPMTSGPVYLGAGIVLLALLGAFLLRGAEKWALLAVAGLSILLAWGSNLQWFTDLAFSVIPGYNKFRTVSMILVVCQLVCPLLAFWGLSEYQRGNVSAGEFRRGLLWSTGITAGFTLLVGLVGPLVASFAAPSDAHYLQAGLPMPLIEALRADRASMMRADAMRRMLFVLATALCLYLLLLRRVKLLPLAALLTAIFLADLWPVNKRYDGIAWISKSRNANPFPMSPADRTILQDTTFYRVCNTTVSTFNDASTSYYHNSLGGYHGAKLRRFQDMVDRYAGDPLLLNLLNVKYVISASETNPYAVHVNRDAMGNAWFVDTVRAVSSPDEEIAFLSAVDLHSTALREGGETEVFAGQHGSEPSPSIRLVSHAPNRLVYRSVNDAEGFAVFSEVFYPHGWQARIDGQPAEIARVNYLLRGLRIPAGEHLVEFSFSQPMFYKAQWVDLLFGLGILLLLEAWACLAAVRWSRQRALRNQLSTL